MSNAFERSRKITSAKLPLSKASFHFSRIFSRQCCVLWFLRNPLGRLDKNWSVYLFNPRLYGKISKSRPSLLRGEGRGGGGGREVTAMLESVYL